MLSISDVINNELTSKLKQRSNSRLLDDRVNGQVPTLVRVCCILLYHVSLFNG